MKKGKYLVSVLALAVVAGAAMFYFSHPKNDIVGTWRSVGSVLGVGVENPQDLECYFDYDFRGDFSGSLCMTTVNITTDAVLGVINYDYTYTIDNGALHIDYITGGGVTDFTYSVNQDVLTLQEGSRSGEFFRIPQSA